MLCIGFLNLSILVSCLTVSVLVNPEMPSTNPVYQPTTVNYERHKEWPANYLTDRVIPNCHQKPYLQRLLLIGAILFAIVGLSLAIYALVNDAHTHKEESADVDAPPTFDDNSEEETMETEVPDTADAANIHDHETNVVLGSVGICLILISLAMYIGFLHLRGMCQGLLPLHTSRSGTQLHQGGPSSLHSHSETGPSGISYKGVQVIKA